MIFNKSMRNIFFLLICTYMCIVRLREAASHMKITAKKNMFFFVVISKAVFIFLSPLPPPTCFADTTCFTIVYL